MRIALSIVITIAALGLTAPPGWGASLRPVTHSPPASQPEATWVRGGPDGGPGGHRDRGFGGRDFGGRDFGGRDFAERDYEGRRRDREFRPPPPPPPLPPPRAERFEPPPPPFFPGIGGAPREDLDDGSDDPAAFRPPAWLKDWIATARSRGYSDEELATILERHPRIGRFVSKARRRGVSEREIFATLGLDRWAAQPSYASVAPPPPLPAPRSTAPQPVPVQPIAVHPPAASGSTIKLEVPESLHVSDTEVEITGKVAGGAKGASVFVDGIQVSLAKDGSFRYRRGVPIGETEIKVEARDRQGRGSESLVTVTREPPAITAGVFEPLNPARAKGKRNAKAVALIVGIDRYESAPRAEFAENDANAFYDYATRALGVPGDRVKLLTGPKARRLAVEKAVLAWVQPLVAQGASDVYLFFSGHGLASDDGRDQYLLPYDGDRALLGQSALRRKDLIDALVAAGARSVTLFLDTCYSGGTRGGESLVQAARPILISVKEPELPANVTILAASGRDQLSSSLAGARHGLFSYFLMKGLEGEAANGGRAITAGSLESYLLRQVPGEAAKMGRSQYPELTGDPGRILSEW